MKTIEILPYLPLSQRVLVVSLTKLILDDTFWRTDAVGQSNKVQQ